MLEYGVLQIRAGKHLELKVADKVELFDTADTVDVTFIDSDEGVDQRGYITKDDARELIDHLNRVFEFNGTLT